MEIKVLGGCCGNCDTVMKMVADKAADLGIVVSLEKVTDMAAILGYGVMSTPGVVIDGKVVHAGSVPKPSQVEAWLKA